MKRRRGTATTESSAMEAGSSSLICGNKEYYCTFRYTEPQEYGGTKYRFFHPYDSPKALCWLKRLQEEIPDYSDRWTLEHLQVSAHEMDILLKYVGEDEMIQEIGSELNKTMVKHLVQCEDCKEKIVEWIPERYLPQACLQ